MSTIKPDLSVTFGPLKMKNPLMTSSGTFGYGQEYAELFDLNRLGGIVVKGLSVNPKTGNPPPRIVETDCGMLNAIGLANMGLKAFVERIVPWLAKLTTRVVVNIYGHTVDEYRAVTAGLKGIDAVSALEVNISCPNVECGGMVFGTDPAIAARVTEQVLKNADKPVIVKLSPNVTDIREMARAVEGAGAHVFMDMQELEEVEFDVPDVASIMTHDLPPKGPA